jgi:hypothetical protein
VDALIAYPAESHRRATEKRVLINALLISHLLAVTLWCVPITIPLTLAARRPIRPYLLWSGLFQSWDMFSPSPKSANTFIAAIVLYKDGDTLNWTFPRMEQMSLTDRYLKERYRKFAESLSQDNNLLLWPDAARFIARVNNNRRVSVRNVFLVRYWSDIAPPADGPYHQAPWNAHLFYGYEVKPEDLK